jgi:hypothetical protein
MAVGLGGQRSAVSPFKNMVEAGMQRIVRVAAHSYLLQNGVQWPVCGVGKVDDSLGLHPMDVCSSDGAIARGEGCLTGLLLAELLASTVEGLEHHSDYHLHAQLSQSKIGCIAAAMLLFSKFLSCHGHPRSHAE